MIISQNSSLVGNIIRYAECIGRHVRYCLGNVPQAINGYAETIRRDAAVLHETAVAEFTDCEEMSTKTGAGTMIVLAAILDGIKTCKSHCDSFFGKILDFVKKKCVELRELIINFVAATSTTLKALHNNKNGGDVLITGFGTGLSWFA